MLVRCLFIVCMVVWSFVKSISFRFIWSFRFRSSRNMAAVVQFGWLWFLQKIIIGL